jgi:hypothetical protein
MSYFPSFELARKVFVSYRYRRPGRIPFTGLLFTNPGLSPSASDMAICQSLAPLLRSGLEQKRKERARSPMRRVSCISMMWLIMGFLRLSEEELEG